MKIGLFIFSFLLFFIFINPTSADHWENGTLEFNVNGEYDIDLETGTGAEIVFGATTTTLTLAIDDVGMVGTPTVLVYEDVYASGKDDWEDIPQSVGGPFEIGTGGEYGVGSFYIMRSAVSGIVDVRVYFDESYNAPEGSHTVTLYSPNLYAWYSGISKTVSNINIINMQKAALGLCLLQDSTYTIAEKTGQSGVVTLYNTGLFENDYMIYTDYSYGEFQILRDGTGAVITSSSVVIRNSTGGYILDTGYSSDDATYYFPNESAAYYIRPEADGIEHLIYTTVPETPDYVASGTISFNESYYTYPDRVNVSYIINDMDGSNEYWMTVQASQDGSTNWQYVDHDYEPEITDSEGNRSVALFTGSFDFPFYIKAILYEYDSSSGDTTILDSSDVIPYNSGYIPPGTISTDKSTYSIGEFVEITYTTQVENNYISVHGPWKKWYRPNVPIGTNISFLYELEALDAGEVEVGLGENGVKVDSVSITVNQESGGAYVAWMNDNFNLGQMIGFYYNSTNTSAQIRVYDGENNLVFGPLTTSLGYNDGFVNTEGTEPGTFLVSMLHNGTYYNDTTTVSVTDTWVRFGSNKYHIGDTIEIEYYLSDSAQSILLFDGNREKIITFTTQHAVLIPYSMQTIEFTLSEENEYGIDIPDLIDSGALPLGYWYVHVMDGNGVLDDYAWDNTYVSIATDDESYGIDASNEIITTFFSPEGLFMIFTAALAFMGLVAAKHPAGGGAGAVIGVGFGVYFNVLPVWMLMLMVIAFVVMAGATAAANLGGKK